MTANITARRSLSVRAIPERWQHTVVKLLDMIDIDVCGLLCYRRAQGDGGAA